MNRKHDENNENGTATTCAVCGEATLVAAPEYSKMLRVTSDCRPWRDGGRLNICANCGCGIKTIDAEWFAETEEIYSRYEIYHQGLGAEQKSFTGASQGEPRSQRLLSCLAARVKLDGAGRLLDIGCGNGALLNAFNSVAPGWTLAGSELHDKYRDIVEAIPGVEAMHVSQPGEIAGVFDMITMVHVLEHIPEPLGFLGQLREKLCGGGLLLVEIPSFIRNPFDLLIADHAVHFTAEGASALLRRAGFEALEVSFDWVQKELTILARRTETPEEIIETGQTRRTAGVSGFAFIKWLEEVAADARTASTAGTFGIFGTSIAATWLFSELEGNVDFFADEDSNRAGRRLFGRPIIHPDEIQPESSVYIALPPPVSTRIAARLSRGNRCPRLHVPPPLPSE